MTKVVNVGIKKTVKKGIPQGRGCLLAKSLLNLSL